MKDIGMHNDAESTKIATIITDSFAKIKMMIK